MDVHLRDLHLPYPLGHGPPYPDPPTPTSSDDGDKKECLPHRFKFRPGTKRHLPVTPGQARRVKLRRDATPRQEYEEATLDVVRDGSDSAFVMDEAVVQTEESQGGFRGLIAYLGNRIRAAKQDNILLHVPGAFPEDIPESMLGPDADTHDDSDLPTTASFVGDHTTQYSMKDINETKGDSNALRLKRSCASNPPQPTPIVPLNPAFLIPSEPPSPLLPASGSGNGPSATFTLSMWHDYYVSFDRESEQRAVKSLRRAGYTVTKQGRACGLTEVSVAETTDDSERLWKRYLEESHGEEAWEFIHRIKEAERVETRPFPKPAVKKEMPTTPANMKMRHKQMALAPLIQEPSAIPFLQENGRFNNEAKVKAQVQVEDATDESHHPVSTLQSAASGALGSTALAPQEDLSSLESETGATQSAAEATPLAHQGAGIEVTDDEVDFSPTGLNRDLQVVCQCPTKISAPVPDSHTHTAVCSSISPSASSPTPVFESPRLRGSNISPPSSPLINSQAANPASQQPPSSLPTPRVPNLGNSILGTPKTKKTPAVVPTPPALWTFDENEPDGVTYHLPPNAPMPTRWGEGNDYLTSGALRPEDMHIHTQSD